MNKFILPKFFLAKKICSDPNTLRKRDNLRPLDENFITAVYLTLELYQSDLNGNYIIDNNYMKLSNEFDWI